MNHIEEELMKAISKQTTDNVPKIYIQNMVSGRVFEYGKNCHDKLLISEDGRSLTYYNLQDGDGSCVGDYRFYYEKPKIETEEDKRNACDIDEWARMVKHQSISELLAEERNKVVQQLRELAKNEFEFIICDECYNTVDKDVYISSSALNEILNQIERSE